MDVKVSVIVIAHNEERYISRCLDSLLGQAYVNFEIIVVDSFSTDNTLSRIREFEARDKRVKLVWLGKTGYATARNAGLEAASGELLFFTDADCVASSNWIENGLKGFEDDGISGVCGLTYYVSEEYKPTVRDRVVYNKNGGAYPTCNIAYRKEALRQTGNFNQRYDVGLEDWDMAFRVLKHGRIVFSRDMLVCHQKRIKEITLDSAWGSINRIKGAVFLIKDHYGNPRIPRLYVLTRVCTPAELAIVLFPPAIFLYYMLAGKRMNLFKDLYFVVFDYFILVIRRVVIWKTALKEKVFLV